MAALTVFLKATILQTGRNPSRAPHRSSNQKESAEHFFTEFKKTQRPKHRREWFSVAFKPVSPDGI